MMLTAETRQKLKKLELRAIRRINSLWVGSAQSAFRGHGLEFEEVRPYIPGDEVRAIDWNVSARMNQTFVRVYREDRDMMLSLVIDVSGSMYFGSCTRTKIETAMELAAMLGFVADQNQHQVGLALCADDVVSFLPPTKRRSTMSHIMQTMSSYEPMPFAKTKALTVAKKLIHLFKRRSLLVWFTDLWGDEFNDAMQLLATRHELVCVQILDPLENQSADLGMVDFYDAESNNFLTTDIKPSSFPGEGISKKWPRRARVIQVSTTDDLMKPLSSILRIGDAPVKRGARI